MRRLIKHTRRWNVWRKCNINGPIHKLLVLLGFIKSPTFVLTLTNDELSEVVKGFTDALSMEERK